MEVGDIVVRFNILDSKCPFEDHSVFRAELLSHPDYIDFLEFLDFVEDECISDFALDIDFPSLMDTRHVCSDSMRCAICVEIENSLHPHSLDILVSMDIEGGSVLIDTSNPFSEVHFAQAHFLFAGSYFVPPPLLRKDHYPPPFDDWLLEISHPPLHSHSYLSPDAIPNAISAVSWHPP